MDNEKISQAVKDLRKREGLSQEKLAEKSGLSLRTIQRVENEDTEPTGDTLMRIAATFNVTPDELINWDNNKDTLRRTVKIKEGYLHILDKKLVVTKTGNVNDLDADYGKSQYSISNNLMLLLVMVPLFTAISVFTYYRHMIDSAIFSGAFAFFYLISSFRTLLFISETSSIKLQDITKIKIRKNIFQCVVVISHIESGRLKEQFIPLRKDQFELMKDSLLSENLIDEKDIVRGHRLFAGIVVVIIFPLVMSWILSLFNKEYSFETYIGILFLLMSAELLIRMIFQSHKTLFSKQKTNHC